jgi:hypothetical protein
MAIPNTEYELLAWGRSFIDVASPDPQQYGMTPQLLEELQNAYQAYATAWTLASAASTRTTVAVTSKNLAMREFQTVARRVVRVCDSWPGLTDAQRHDLGLHVRKQRVYRVAVPELVPRVDLRGVQGFVVELLIREPSTGKRVRPAGVHSVSIYSHVGNDPPREPGMMRHRMTSTNLKVTLDFGFGLPAFSKVWVSACYLNPRGEPGPMSRPVPMNLGSTRVEDTPEVHTFAA